MGEKIIWLTAALFSSKSQRRILDNLISQSKVALRVRVMNSPKSKNFYIRKNEFFLMTSDQELVTCNSRVCREGQRSQSDPQPAGLSLEQQQPCLVVFEEDWSTQ